MIVAIITEQKANALQGYEFASNSFYNPLQTSIGQWFVSLVEAQYLQLTDIVELIDYEPPAIE